MQYVATKRLKLGGNNWADPGDVVPGVEAWPYRIQKCHLALGWIKAVEDSRKLKADMESAKELVARCPHCPKRFRSDKFLELHIKREHGA